MAGTRSRRASDGAPGSPSPLRSHVGGFAYLMMLFLVTVMGIALASVATVWHTTAQREKEKELLFIGQQFRDALRSYAGYKAGSQDDVVAPSANQPIETKYPESLDQLLRDPRAPNVRRHLRRIYVDPLTGKPEWGLVRRGGRIVGVYSLAEGKPLIHAGFPEWFKQFEKAKTYADWRFLAEATAKSDDDKGDGRAPPSFKPEERPAIAPESSSPPPQNPTPTRAPRVVDETMKCEQVQERAVEQCWSDINSDDENMRCQNAAQELYWQCQKQRTK